MNPALLVQLWPYAARIEKAAATLKRLEADPDVQDAISLMGEIGALVVQAQKGEQHG